MTKRQTRPIPTHDASKPEDIIVLTPRGLHLTRYNHPSEARALRRRYHFAGRSSRGKRSR